MYPAKLVPVSVKAIRHTVVLVQLNVKKDANANNPHRAAIVYYPVQNILRSILFVLPKSNSNFITINHFKQISIQSKLK